MVGDPTPEHTTSCDIFDTSLGLLFSTISSTPSRRYDMAMKFVPVALFVDDAASLGFEGLAMMHSLVADNNLPGLMLVMVGELSGLVGPDVCHPQQQHVDPPQSLS
jgi:hypothetical protein